MQLISHDPHTGNPVFYLDGVWVLCARCAEQVPVGRVDGPHRIEWHGEPDGVPRCERCHRPLV
ncbi:hypothetical protein [Sulfobacillus thermosulfidooxidans]|uniref:hypothetical protein n=1 Tax=Sulfobacillus thermosulfidooxidans TaxID=28034 RepID=UPI0006B44F16|nr:hypothetical protein [Sulfobacillus thermosulfidooxidans]